MPFDASVRAYLRAYQNEYRAALHGGQHTAELSFRVPMHEMFRRIAHDLNPAGTFDIILEPRNQGRMGRPDWRIQDRISLGVYGYIEAKGPSNEPFDTTPYRDQINRYLTLGQKPLGVTQNIGTVYGTVNQQGGGTINSETTVLAGNLDQIAEIEKMIEKILPHLDDIPDIPKDAADDVKDDLESVKEQINAPAPKKKRLQKAIGGIKKFFGDFSPQLAAALAAHAITTTDWNAMIASVEKLISSL